MRQVLILHPLPAQLLEGKTCQQSLAFLADKGDTGEVRFVRQAYQVVVVDVVC